MGRQFEHRNAMLSNMVCSLIKHKRITTTLAKAKAARSVAEKIVTLGNGGLVCSLYSEDQEFLEGVVHGVASHHGRVFLGHPKIELSPGPGTVLPQLVHGGPGRAGGGEELGGPRGLAFYMQRVALEGSRPVIQKLTGQKQ